MDVREMLINDLSEDVSCELQKIIFSKTMKGEDPCEDGKFLYVCDASCFFGIDKLKFKGPYDMYAFENGYDHIYTLLLDQFKAIQNRVRLLSKIGQNIDLKNVSMRYEKRFGKDAYTPTDEHIGIHVEMGQYINYDLIPSKYVVLCVIAFSNEGFLTTTYHFVRWYSFDYVTTGFKAYMSSSTKDTTGVAALGAMLSFAAKDESDTAYVFPEVKHIEDAKAFVQETILLTPQDVWGLPE